MEHPIIEIKNIGKKYTIRHDVNKYGKLSYVLGNIFKNPIQILKEKFLKKNGSKEIFWALSDVSF